MPKRLKIFFNTLSIRRKIILIVSLLALGSLGCFIYFHTLFLPFYMKRILVHQIAEFFGRPVKVSELQFNPITGFTAKKLVIFEKEPRGETFISVDRISFSLIYLSIFREKKFFIPSLTIEKPLVHIKRLKNGKLNIDDIIERQKKYLSRKKKPFSVLIGRLSSAQAQIEFSDHSLPEKFHRILHLEQLQLRSSLKEQFQFDFQAIVPSPKASALLKGKGTFDIARRALSGLLHLENLPIGELLPMYVHPKNFILKKGTIPKADIVITAAKGVWQLRTQFQVAEAMAELGETRKFYGSPTIQASGTFDPQAPIPFKYQGALISQKSRISGLPIIKQLKDIQGIVLFSNDQLASKNLIAYLEDDTKVDLNIKMSHFRPPQIDFIATGLLKMGRAADLFPDFFKKTRIALNGDSFVTYHYRRQPPLSPAGAAHPKKQSAPLDPKPSTGTGFTLTVLVEPRQGALHHDKFPGEIDHISGGVLYDHTSRSVTWKDLHARWQEIDYTLSGFLKDPEEALVDTRISSANMTLTVQAKMLTDFLKLANVNFKTKESDLNLKGRVKIPENGDWQVRLDGQGNLDLKDLPLLLPQSKNLLTKIPIEGKLQIKDFYFSKITADWRPWRVLLNAQSPELSLYGYRLKDISLTWNQKDNRIQTAALNGQAYNGNFSLQGDALLSDETLPFKATLALSKADLSQFKNDSPLKEKELSGFVSSNLSLNGSLKDWSTLQGQGTIHIQDGLIWQVNLLRGLGMFLFIPEFDHIVFRQASGNFIIANSRFNTQNLVFAGNELSLLCQGWVDFKGRLNFEILTNFSESTIQKSTSLKKAITNIISYTGNYIPIKLTGTIKDPKYDILSLPVNILKGAADLLLESWNHLWK